MGPNIDRGESTYHWAFPFAVYVLMRRRFAAASNGYTGFRLRFTRHLPR